MRSLIRGFPFLPLVGLCWMVLLASAAPAQQLVQVRIGRLSSLERWLGNAENTVNKNDKDRRPRWRRIADGAAVELARQFRESSPLSQFQLWDFRTENSPYDIVVSVYDDVKRGYYVLDVTLRIEEKNRKDEVFTIKRDVPWQRSSGPDELLRRTFLNKLLAAKDKSEAEVSEALGKRLAELFQGRENAIEIAMANLLTEKVPIAEGIDWGYSRHYKGIPAVEKPSTLVTPLDWTRFGFLTESKRLFPYLWCSGESSNVEISGIWRKKPVEIADGNRGTYVLGIRVQRWRNTKDVQPQEEDVINQCGPGFSRQLMLYFPLGPPPGDFRCARATR